MKFFKKIIGAFGYKLVKKNFIKSLRVIDEHLCPPEIFIKSLIDSKKIKKIIQVGANDGIRDDFLHKCLKKNMDVLFVEPIPGAFKRLRYNYRYYKKSIFLNVAVDIKKTKKLIFTINPSYSNNYKNSYKDQDKEWLSILASFNKNHLIKHGIKNNHIISKTIQTVTFKEIMSKYDYFNTDLIVIDVEGFDDILVINFLKTIKTRPTFVFEYEHLNKKKLEKVLKILRKNNYNIIKTQKDFLCLHKNIFKKN